MQQHYGGIHSVMSINPADIAIKLFANKFINFSTLGMATEGETAMSHDGKAHKLAQACIVLITSHKEPEGMLRKLLEIFKESEPVGPNVAEAISEVSST